MSGYFGGGDGVTGATADVGGGGWGHFLVSLLPEEPCGS